MKTLIINATLVLIDRQIKDGWLLIDNDIIEDFGIGPFPKCDVDITIDANDEYLSPGFVDTHVHGAMGHSFEDGTETSILESMRFHLQGGTTSILDTITSTSHDAYIKAFNAFNSLIDKFDFMYDIPNFEGIHMEGPYCSDAVLGAQDTTTYRDVNFKEVEQYLEMAPYIKKWTAACERKGGLEFGKLLERKGIVASIGHSNATLAEVQEAFECGYHSITHLYSACSSYHRNGAYREGGIVEAAWLIDQMNVEMITDGKHLPPEFLKLIYKIKGADNICLITDAIRLAGVNDIPSLKQAHPELKHSEVIVEDGVAFVPDKRCFAGSIATTNRLIRVATQQAGISLVDAVKMASHTPARVCHLDQNIGSIQRGKEANLLIFNENIDIQHIFLRGKMIK